MRLIDVDELKKPVGSYNPVKWTSEYGYVISVEDIDHAPTVDPVKHGRWERHYSRPDVLADLYWHCSECGYKTANQWANRYHKFCPYCGAKMDGDKNE